MRKKRKNQQGLLFTGPEGYIAHLGTHSEVTGRELYYFCSFSVNLKLFKISLEKNALQKMFKKVIEKIWCLVRNCFLVHRGLSSPSMVEEDGGDVLLRFLFKGTNSICEGSILMFLSPPKVLTSKFYHIGDQLKYKFGGNTNIQFTVA